MAAHRNPLTERRSTDGPPLDYLAFVPPHAVRRPLVAVHGSSRGAARYFRAFLPMAVAHDLPLIVPTFGPERFGGYQQLAGEEGPMAAEQALSATLTDVHDCLGVETASVDLLGFSGGAQFAHRYAMLVPQAVRRLVVIGAGWYTYLDPSRGFPRGSAPSPASGGRPVDAVAFLGLPVHVLVGERDLQRDASLRTGGRIDRRQGVDRLTRALRWVDHLDAEARAHAVPSKASFDLLPGTGHSFTEAVHRGGLVERTWAYLQSVTAAGLVETIPGPEGIDP